METLCGSLGGDGVVITEYILVMLTDQIRWSMLSKLLLLIFLVKANSKSKNPKKTMPAKTKLPDWMNAKRDFWDQPPTIEELNELFGLEATHAAKEWIVCVVWKH